MANETDDKTLKLIEQIKLQKQEIAKAERPNWATNCSFSAPNMGTTNLHVETDIRHLVSIAAFLVESEKNYYETAKLLGVEAPSFVWQGFTAKEWLEDIKTRINKVQIASKKKKLESLEARLNAIISPELRAKMELEAIEAELP